MGLAIGLAVLTAGCGPNKPPRIPYATYQAGFQNKLVQTGPSPQTFDTLKLTEKMKWVSYSSEQGELKGVLCYPQKNRKSYRGMVYLHQGHALTQADLSAIKPFLDASYVVFLPTFRGEQGNPGTFEMFLGEVDDAVAATNWLRDQTDINSNEVFVFGHSSGGALASLLSLRDDVPMQLSGSCNGLFYDRYSGWRYIAPYDQTDTTQAIMRQFVGFGPDMKQRHLAFIGKQDAYFSYGWDILLEEAEDSPNLTIKQVKGDHFTSLDPAIRAFLKAVK
ncbi:alpha/beta hydrolase fold domain-containing protein [Pontibacter sp. G13]|uniref:alpha/beta hydrolase n=1 Tax=Pontibacter sp. G13 TaxID=3074898 RepID=UPI00288C0B27|nr:alpha/beta hydrolase fold domain-containing protein [Pontibacter sp. G13]WNJ20676.1 CocE/NonD family hydrolase [Pontibacter sp. G13]